MSDSDDDNIIVLEDRIEDRDLETFEEAGDEAIEETPAEGEAENTEAQPVKPKRIIRNPQPKLNEETLKGKRGLTALESYFDRVKFKGHGHEEQDLAVILKTYEYWCHRLFPKYPFDASINKIERLGTKRAVVTHIKRIRTNLIFEDTPIVNDNDSETEDLPHNTFDDLVAIPNAQQIPVSNSQEIPNIAPVASLSSEQMERIRLNKERAERIRREKLRQRMELDGASTSGSQNVEMNESVPEQTESQPESFELNGENTETLDMYASQESIHNSENIIPASSVNEVLNQDRNNTNPVKNNSIIDSDEDG